MGRGGLRRGHEVGLGLVVGGEDLGLGEGCGFGGAGVVSEGTGLLVLGW